MAKTVEDHDSKQEPRLFTEDELNEVQKTRDHYWNLYQETDGELTLVKGINSKHLADIKVLEAEKKELDENYRKLQNENMVSS